MDHAEIVGRLSAYLDNAVSRDEKEMIKHHLGCCGSCREVLAGMEWTVEQLKRLPDVESPHWLTGQVMTAVQQAPSRRPAPWRGLFFPLQVKLPLLLGGMVVICSGAYRILRTAQPPSPAASVLQSPPSPGPVAPSGPPSAAAPSRSPRMITSAAREGKEELSPPVVSPASAVAPAAAIPARTDARTVPVPALPGDTAEPGLQPADEWTVPEPEPDDQVRRLGTGRAAAVQRQTVEADVQALRGEGVEVVLVVENSAGSTARIEDAVSRSGGWIRGHSYSDSARVLFAQVEVQKLQGLLDRLARVGTVERRPPAAAGRSGKIDVVIRW